MGKETLPRIATAAVAGERLTGCPAELLAAQCILESGWLQHAPGNNCFGIKSFKGEFGRQLLTTKEWFKPSEVTHFRVLGDGRVASLVTPLQFRGARRLYIVKDWFASFSTLNDCFIKRASMWDKGPYAPAAKAFREGGTVEDLVRAIAPIYATAPGYADTVLSLVRSTDLRMALAAVRTTAARPDGHLGAIE